MNKEEFQQAVQRLRPQMKGLALHYLTDRDDAEDAVQDALIRLWQMHEQLQAPIDGLAKTLTRNICIDLLRRRHATLDTILAAEAEQTETADHEQVERMMAAIDTLPQQQQTMLRLRHMQGMEMKDLAALMQMNEPALRKALSRARMAVRKLYLKQIAAVLVLAVGLTAILWFYRQQEDECVAYIYGRKTTDRNVVMQEMLQSAETMTAGAEHDDVERQLNEMFNME